MHKLGIGAVPLVVSILMLTVLVPNQNAFAATVNIIDNASCAAAGGTIVGIKCKFAGSLTIPAGDVWTSTLFFAVADLTVEGELNAPNTMDADQLVNRGTITTNELISIGPSNSWLNDCGGTINLLTNGFINFDASGTNHGTINGDATNSITTPLAANNLDNSGNIDPNIVLNKVALQPVASPCPAVGIVFEEHFDGVLTGWSESVCNRNDPSQICSLIQDTNHPNPLNPSSALPASPPNWGAVRIESFGSGSLVIPVEVRHQKTFNVAEDDDYDISAVIATTDCSQCIETSRLFVDGFLVFARSGADVSITPPSSETKFFESATIPLSAGSHTIEIGMHSTAAVSGDFRASFDDIIIRGVVPDFHQDILTEVQNIEEKLDGDRPSLITQIVDSLTSIVTDIGTVLGILQDENSGIGAIKSDTEMIKSDIEMLKDQFSIIDKKLDILLEDDFSQDTCEEFKEKAEQLEGKGKEIPIELEKKLALCDELFP